MKEVNDLKEKNSIFKIDSSSYNLPMKIDIFESVQKYKYFIKNVEKMVRGSQEYRNWISYLKNELSVDQCMLTHESMSEVSIEIHHHPISLRNICCIVTDTMMQNKEKFTSFDIAQIVLGLHFANKVGYIPLVKTLHEKFHNGYLKIPISLVQGEWEYITSNFIVSPEISIVIKKYAEIGDEALLNITWKKDDYDGINQLGLNKKENNLSKNDIKKKGDEE